MKTRITELLGIEYPIIQGGMAWVAESHLAAAVSAAGGLGLIGGANAPAEVIRNYIREVKAVTDKPFGVNVMLMSPYADEVAKVVVEEGVKVVTTGAGNPEKYMEMWKAAGIKVIPVVASVALAKRMERYGADAVVAEGTESGGHIGEATTMTLVPQVVDAVSIPVIAAGGIYDRSDVQRMEQLGADGVQVATRFVTTKECDAHRRYKEAYLKAVKDEIAIVKSPVGMPGRAIRNTFLDKVKSEGRIPPTKCLHCIHTCNPAETPYCITEALIHAAKGETENALLFCGGRAYEAKTIETVKKVIDYFCSSCI